MKNFILCCFVLSLSFGQILLAIDPPYDCYQPEDCGSIRYPYKFCNALTGEIYNICVQDPYNITEEELAPWSYPSEEYDFVPMKLNLPICPDFNPLIDMPAIPGGEVIVPICGGNTCSHGVSFRTADVTGDIQKAFDYWNCMCGTQNDHCQCSIKVKFSDNPQKFKNHKSDPTSSSIMDIYEKPGCQFDCEDLVIYINNTRDFVRADNGSTTGFNRVNENFYVTSSVIPALRAEYQASGRAPYASNLTKIVANELGQMLGLGLYREIGLCNCGWPGNNSSVMSKNYSNEWDNIQANSDYDHCAFKQLYCNTSDVQVIEEDWLDVKFNSNTLIVTNKNEQNLIKRITVSDYLGRVLMELTKPIINDTTLQINMDKFTDTRVLLINIETESKIITKKIIR
ncbi:MAG: hypothetical protein WC313_05550 [Candidatus Kapaibacterium sp.]